MSKYKNCKELREIYGLLYFHLMKMTLRLLPFMDRCVSLPSSKEIADTLKAKNRSAEIGARVIQGRPLPEQQQIIELSEPYTEIVEKYGGLDEIRSAFEDWGHSNPGGYKMLLDWSQKGIKGLKTMADIADQNGYSHSSAPYKLRDKHLGEISFNILIRFRSKQSKKPGNK